MTLLRPVPSLPEQPKKITPAGLRLQLVATEGGENSQRTNDGHYSLPAQVALSYNLRAGLLCDDLLLSHEAIGDLHLSIRQAWNRAASNSINVESDTKGVAVQTRPSRFLTGDRTPGVQINFTHTQPTAWLAHPHTFKTLYLHLCSILREEACFYAISDSILLATGLCDSRIELESWIAELEVPPAKVSRRIYYRNGFPSTRPSTRLPAAPAAVLPRRTQMRHLKAA